MHVNTTVQSHLLPVPWCKAQAFGNSYWGLQQPVTFFDNRRKQRDASQQRITNSIHRVCLGRSVEGTHSFRQPTHVTCEQQGILGNSGASGMHVTDTTVLPLFRTPSGKDATQALSHRQPTIKRVLKLPPQRALQLRARHVEGRLTDRSAATDTANSSRHLDGIQATAPCRYQAITEYRQVTDSH
jgi:hypothetical protein